MADRLGMDEIFGRRVLSTSDESAEYRTNIKGWVDRHGGYHGTDERSARYDGATHIPCEKCGDPSKKQYENCDECREALAADRYSGLERKEWDGKTPLYSEVRDEFYYDEDDIIDCLLRNEDEGVTTKSLRLVICEPNYFSQVGQDFWEDDLPYGGEISVDMLAAMNALNAVIEEEEPPTWRPGAYAVELPLPFENATPNNGRSRKQKGDRL